MRYDASAPEHGGDVIRLGELVRLRNVRDRIDRDYAQPLDVEALARAVHLPAGQLTREFRRGYGQSPYGYLMTRRVERATALLRGGDLSVTEVCFAVGWSSMRIFCTRFTELVGVPPCSYRPRPALRTAEMPVRATGQSSTTVRNQEAQITEPG